ncbi:hypothetical protein CARUB_v10007313mg [Capsella rubella]|uniref:Uncharacterized protein n=1 Tax=Capsella rubella TaxID=81985 RepID=R0FAH3_9BRAS|nr:uncharacterized protein LOC17878815 [Capsella rubella]EOA18731.1 hypothetical protein CARUB_v10007313mg [Capsella rubella]
MALALRYYIVVLLLSMVSQGLCHCNFSKIQIGTVRTGREIAGQPEWEVTVINTCNCLQKHVTLSCGGFAPVKRVEPWLLLPQGRTCLMIKGEALPAGASAKFSYAGEPYIFRPIGSSVDRSCKNYENKNL